MAEALLSVSQAANLEKCTKMCIRKRIYENRIPYTEVSTTGAHGFEYRIPVSALSADAKRRYYKEQAANGSGLNDTINYEKACKPLDSLTEEQRRQVEVWKGIIARYKAFLTENCGTKSELTSRFVSEVKAQYPDLRISQRTLYTKIKRLKDYGESALADMRKGGNRTDTGETINTEVKEAFRKLWLTESRPTIPAVLRKLESYYNIERPDLLPLPSVSTFRRYAGSIPKPVIELYRNGNTAFANRCSPYLERDYSSIMSNDIWQADYHTCDFWVKDDNTAEKFRPHLIVWTDVKSRKVMSFGLFGSSNSHGTIRTFKRAVKQYGIPKSVYLDNGREFLVRDFGGRGRRKEDKSADYGTPILDRLGVKMHNAIPAHGQSKQVERFFEVFKENFSKFIPTYTGGKPHERPESLDKLMEDSGNIPLLSYINKLLCDYIEGEYNVSPSQAKGLNGMTPNECYGDNLFEKRVAREDDLNILMLRTERLQTVQRNGVKLLVSGETVWYYSTELILDWQGKKVFVKYDPDNLDTVRVYDEKERFIMTAEISRKGGYSFDSGADIEAIKERNKRAKALKNAVKRYKNSGIEIPEATKIIEMAAEERVAEMSNAYDAKVLVPLQYQDTAYQNAVGDGREKIDFGRIVKDFTT